MYIDYDNEPQLNEIKNVLKNYSEEIVVRFCGDILSMYANKKDEMGKIIGSELHALHRKLQVIECSSFLTKGMTCGDIDLAIHFPNSIHGKDTYMYLEWKVDNGTNKFDDEYFTENKQFIDHQHIINCNTVTRDCVVFLLYRGDKVKIQPDRMIVNGMCIKPNDLSETRSEIIHDFDGLTLIELVRLWKGEKIKLSLSKDFQFFHGTLIPNGCIDNNVIERPGGIRPSPVYMYDYTGVRSVSNLFLNNVIDLEDILDGTVTNECSKFLFPATLDHIFNDIHRLCYTGFKESNQKYDYGIYVKLNNKVYDLDYHFKWKEFDENNRYLFYEKLRKIVENKLNRNKFNLYEVLP